MEEIPWLGSSSVGLHGNPKFAHRLCIATDSCQAKQLHCVAFCCFTATHSTSGSSDSTCGTATLAVSGTGSKYLSRVSFRDCVSTYLASGGTGFSPKLKQKPTQIC